MHPTDCHIGSLLPLSKILKHWHLQNTRQYSDRTYDEITSFSYGSKLNKEFFFTAPRPFKHKIIIFVTDILLYFVQVLFLMTGQRILTRNWAIKCCTWSLVRYSLDYDNNNKKSDDMKIHKKTSCCCIWRRERFYVDIVTKWIRIWT